MTEPDGATMDAPAQEEAIEERASGKDNLRVSHDREHRARSAGRQR